MFLTIFRVENLKAAIHSQYGYHPDDQVLLISGGESLIPTARVCKYSSAGTDTSPIFLFIKNQDESILPAPYTDEIDTNMSDRVRGCLQMEANFNTIVAGTEMAIQVYDTDKHHYHACDRLVHEQHLQQQGWAAVVANLDDIVTSFRSKFRLFEKMYRELLENKAKYYQLLERYL